MSGLVDSCDLELLQKSCKMGKKLTISMSGLDFCNNSKSQESTRPDIEIVSFFPVLFDFCNNSKSQESTKPDIEKGKNLQFQCLV
jgi:hypothetical protein